MEERPTYTINEAAGLTGLHKNTIRQRIRLGQLRATIQQGKFGEEYRIPHEALVEAGLLPDAGPLEGADDSVLHAEFIPAGPAANGTAEPDAEPTAAPTVAALTELYQRHEQAMFRLGYMQGELDRVKALAETAESLRHDNEERRREVETLRSALDEREQRAAEAERLREELAAAQARLQEIDTLRQSIDHLKSLASEQERVIEALEEKGRRPWWRFWS